MIAANKIHKEKQKISDKFAQPFVVGRTGNVKQAISEMNNMQKRIKPKRKK